MARYIDADKLIKHLEDELNECSDPILTPVAFGTQLGLKSAIAFAETLSTEDVVPKSEVEKIFKDIQSCLIQRNWDGLNIVSFEIDAVKYAELKKKYTEN